MDHPLIAYIHIHEYTLTIISDQLLYIYGLVYSKTHTHRSRLVMAIYLKASDINLNLLKILTLDVTVSSIEHVEVWLNNP